MHLYTPQYTSIRYGSAVTQKVGYEEKDLSMLYLGLRLRLLGKQTVVLCAKAFIADAITREQVSRCNLQEVQARLCGGGQGPWSVALQWMKRYLGSMGTQAAICTDMHHYGFDMCACKCRTVCLIPTWTLERTLRRAWGILQPRTPYEWVAASPHAARHTLTRT